MKLIKDIWNKIADLIDDIATQLGLQPKPVPVPVKNNNDRRQK